MSLTQDTKDLGIPVSDILFDLYSAFDLGQWRGSS